MDDRLLTDARMIVRDFVRLRPDETIALVCDREHRDESEALALAVDELGATAITIDISQSVDRLLSSEAFWIAPPPQLLAALRASNVSLFVVDETFAFRLDHRVPELVEAGPGCSVFKLDAGMGSWGLTDDDILLVERIGRRLVGAIDGHDQVRVTSAAGTDLSLSVLGRRCLPILPVPERGKPYGLSIPLWGEYNWAPLEDRSNGVVVIDGLSEAGHVMHSVSEPVVITIENGRAVAIEGGADADDFRRVLATDAGAAVLGELGVGGNPKAMLGRETEKALLGTIHVGFGNNAAYPGGVNRSAIHVDGVVRDVTLEVDGQVVMRAGRLVDDDRVSSGVPA